MKASLLSLLVLAAAIQAGHWKVAASYAANVERIIELPRGAYPLLAYARFYNGRVTGTRRLIEATYLRGRRRPGIYLNEPAPDIEDGGCSVVHIWYDVKSARVSAIECNGLA